MLILNITKGLYMRQHKVSVQSLVNKDLRLKLEQGWTVTQIHEMSQNGIEAYCLSFRFQYASQLRPYKDGTVNRYVERFIKANKV